jgi:predicted ester cyclase
MISENDSVIVFLKGTGTHLREFQGRPPTNKVVNMRSADLYRIANNKIVGHWDVMDQLTSASSTLLPESISL